ncbi:unnamed protein product [Chilo suppressalis]|uniref:UDP-glucuronosyltransferase n=1 Tax=Chilo suppressalis TaxID=168631 RepID=A0ABN8B2U9_CHISP|nr:unnamed protein product [Chilo suppressalis]
MLISNTIWSTVLFAATVNSARILGVFLLPSISHQFVFRALTLELARRGHELVVITTDPVFHKTRPPYNITEIDVSFIYENFRKIQNVLYQAETIIAVDIYKMFLELYIEEMKHPDVEKLIQDKSQKFDLIIIEGVLNYHLIFTEIFNAPVILMTSFNGLTENFEIVGAVAHHPIFYPLIMRKKFSNLTLIEKISEIKEEYEYMKVMYLVEEYENQLLKLKYGPYTPTVSELKNNVDFLFINSNQMFCNNRPVPSNVAFVGPLHLQPLKELPQELKSFLDNSKTGVIYVSLGTNVRPSLVNQELINSFLDAFEELPYNILWKFDKKVLKRIPKNVKIQEWFPQRDLLAHHNIKLFVMQGGLQSTDEAIDAGVPLVTIPILADQFFNAHKHVQFGIGLSLDVTTLNAKILIDGIKKVINDESYRDNIRKLKEIINDQPQTPMERAVWWTEYVIRHKGARHLRSPAANISWAEYLMADVLIALAAIIFASTLAIVLVIRFVLKTLLTIAIPYPKTKLN